MASGTVNVEIFISATDGSSVAFDSKVNALQVVTYKAAPFRGSLVIAKQQFIFPYPRCQPALPILQAP